MRRDIWCLIMTHVYTAAPQGKTKRYFEMIVNLSSATTLTVAPPSYTILLATTLTILLLSDCDRLQETGTLPLVYAVCAGLVQSVTGGLSYKCQG